MLFLNLKVNHGVGVAGKAAIVTPASHAGADLKYPMWMLV